MKITLPNKVRLVRRWLACHAECIAVVLLLALATFSTGNGKMSALVAWLLGDKWGYLYVYILCFALSMYCGLRLWLVRKNLAKKQLKAPLFVLLAGAAPWLFAALYTSGLFLWGKVPFLTYTRGISVVLQMLCAVLLAAVLTAYFPHEVPDILLGGIALGYVVVLIITAVKLNRYTLLDLLRDPVGSYHAGWLEKHDTGAAAGLLILYYIFQSGTVTHKRLKLAAAGIVMLCSFKRIAFAGLAAACCIGLWLRCAPHTARRRRTQLVAAGIFVLCYVYIGAIQSGLYAQILQGLGVNDMSRLHTLAQFSPHYTFGPFFEGRGLGFNEKLLQGLVSQGVEGLPLFLHNDILKMYIEIGFVGAGLWFASYLFWIPAAAQNKFALKDAHLYCVLVAYMFMLHTADNISARLFTNLVFWALVGQIILPKLQKRGGPVVLQGTGAQTTVFPV